VAGRVGDDGVGDGRLGEFTFQRLTRADFPMLAGWLAQPFVARWWNHEWSPGAMERDFGEAIDGGEAGEDFVVSLDGRPIGLIQRCRLGDYPDYQAQLAPLLEVPAEALSIDYLIGVPELIERGHGSAMIAAFVARCWSDFPLAPAVVVPVVAANERSWRALRRAGFRLVASGDLTPDNPADDPLHHLFQVDRPRD
jgi:aminoglycoside 6'-N-acetyltransferase